MMHCRCFGVKSSPFAAGTFETAIIKRNWWFCHPVSLKIYISLPKSLNSTKVDLGDFRGNVIKWLEFGEKGSQIVKIVLKYDLYGKVWRLAHAKHIFRWLFMEIMLFNEIHQNGWNSAEFHDFIEFSTFGRSPRLGGPRRHSICKYYKGFCKARQEQKKTMILHDFTELHRKSWFTWFPRLFVNFHEITPPNFSAVSYQVYGKRCVNFWKFWVIILGKRGGVDPEPIGYLAVMSRSLGIWYYT